MKKIIILALVCAVFCSCKNENKATPNNTNTEIAYATFGDKIDDKNILSTEDIALKYENLKAGDTVTTKLKGSIKEVCSKKGCWMKLDIGDEKMVKVTFKDYGFFVPTNAEGDVIISGKAFVSETSVEELKHYAEDGGKSKEEIAAITSPKVEYKFEADGVLLQK